MERRVRTMHIIGNGLDDQFERMWMMLREVIGNCPGEEWKRDAGHWFLIPSRLAYHTIETADFYNRESPEGMDWAGRFDVDWETQDAEKLPDREPMLDYLEEIRSSLQSKLHSMSDESFLAGHAFPWTGATVLERMIYTLRHSMFHVGQIQAELRRRGLQGAEWH
jgi:uncharacterized damage-inducible protein DinB